MTALPCPDTPLDLMLYCKNAVYLCRFREYTKITPTWFVSCASNGLTVAEPAKQVARRAKPRMRRRANRAVRRRGFLPLLQNEEVFASSVFNLSNCVLIAACPQSSVSSAEMKPFSTIRARKEVQIDSMSFFCSSIAVDALRRSISSAMKPTPSIFRKQYDTHFQ